MLNIFNTSPEVAASNIDTAVLAMGSVEPKGPHLPVGLDLILANRFSMDFCRGKAVYLLPVFPYSTAMETRGFPGSVSLRQQTLWDTLLDIASNLTRHQFKRLIVLDFSGHNWILKHAVREINLNYRLLQTVWVNPKEFAREAAPTDILPDHCAGAVETSLAMALDPSLARTAPPDFAPDLPREYIDYHGLAAVAPDGYWGRPLAASRDLGDKLYKLMLDKTGDYVDYALTLFPKGAPLAPHDAPEITWPTGEIPGIVTGLDWHSTLAEIKASPCDVAVLPTSSTEQHSTCQPVSTDYLQALELSRRVAAELSAYLLPTLPIVTSWGHIHFRGTVTFSAMTVRRILEDTVESLAAAGFRRIVLINVHGGNWVIKPTIIELNHRLPDVAVVSTGDILAYRGQAPVEELHANESEGSFIRAFYPQAFKTADLVDFSPNCTASAFDLVGIDGVTPKGVWGYPSQSTPEAGRAALDRNVSETTAYLRQALADCAKFTKVTRP